MGRSSNSACRIAFGAVALVASTLALSSTASQAAAADRGPVAAAAVRSELPRAWVGTWRLASETLVDREGTVVGSLYSDPVGRLTYTARGDVWAFVGPRAHPGAATALWYTGTAILFPRSKVVVDHVEQASIAGAANTNVARRFAFAAHGRRLTLSGAVTAGATDELSWRRVGPR